MKEPSAPQVYYDGSLNELASRHVGLVKAVLFTLIISIPVAGISSLVVHGYLYPYNGTRPELDLPHTVLVIVAATFSIHGVCNLLYRFYRLSALLYPHVALYFTLLVLVPWLNLLVILLLWRAGLRQMRGRGLRVGFFGIDPARVE